VASLHRERLEGVGHGGLIEPGPAAPADVELFVAQPGGIAARCGARLHACPPVLAALIVAVVGWVIVTASIIGLGVLLVEVLLHGALGDWDISVVRTFVDARTSPLTDASWTGSGLAETLTVVTAGLGLTLFLILKRAWPAVGLVVLSLVLEITAYLAVTNLVHRQRPFVEQLEQRRQGASFPSGHTAAAVVLYVLIAVVVTMYVTNALARRVAWAAVVLVPVIVALSRIYRGMHHPTDALAGALMGAGCVVVALLAVRTAGVVSGQRRA
jgi:membrane-associated phospholipid phosphatase